MSKARHQEQTGAETRIISSYYRRNNRCFGEYDPKAFGQMKRELAAVSEQDCMRCEETFTDTPNDYCPKCRRNMNRLDMA